MEIHKQEKDTNLCNCSIIPTYLHQNGRSVVIEFQPNEGLFLRFPLEDGNGESNLIREGENVALSQNYFMLKQLDAKMSCNRESLCLEPEDVLYDGKNCVHKIDEGIIRFYVKDIESEVFKHPSENWTYSMKPEHDPIPCMYPHTEIRINKDGEYKRPEADMVKKAIKTHLQDISYIIKS